MHLIELLIQKDQMSGHKHITGLGWVVTAISVLFIGALLFGWIRQITRNVGLPYPDQTVRLAQHSLATATHTPPSPNAKATAPGWTVKLVKTPLGVDVVVAPPEVTKAVLKDYDAALDDWDAHKFDLTYLRAQTPNYFSDRQLSRMQGMLNWLEKEKRAVALREYKLLPLERSVQYAPTGVQAFVIEYIAAGDVYEYDLKTRTKVDEQKMPDRIVMTQMSYDSAAQRWKISRIALSMDLSTKQVLWQDQ